MSEEKKCCAGKMLQLVLLCLILISSTISAVYSYKTNKLLAGGVRVNAQTNITQTYAKNQTIEKAIKTGKPTIVLFYADWCGYCKKFAPVFNDIVKTRKFKSKLSVAFVNGTVPENAKYMQEYKIEGFPTVYMVNFKKNEKIKLENNLLFTPNAKNELLNKFIEFAKSSEN